MNTINRQYTNEEETIFNNYVRQFKHKYKIQCGEDGVWEILCHRGDIEPYSLMDLCCYQAYQSRRGINNLKNALPDYCEITQETSSEVIFKFPNQKLDEIAEIVGVYKKKVLSEAEKERLRQMLKPYAFKKHATREQLRDQEQA